MSESPPHRNPDLDLESKATTGYLLSWVLKKWPCGISLIPDHGSWILEVFDSAGDVHEFKNPKGINYSLADSLD